MNADVSQLVEFAADFRSAKVPALVRPVMSKAGLNMKKGAQAAARGIGAHAKNYARTIQYEMRDGGLAVEVRPDPPGKGSQASLSALLEYGQGRNAAHPHLIPQLDPEAETTADWIGRVIEEALG